jgi:hypothetical protein
MPEAYSPAQSAGYAGPVRSTIITDRDLRFARFDAKKYACPLMSRK